MTEAPPLPPLFGPKPGNHSSVGRPCPACEEPFAAGDYTTWVALGPGANTDAQQRARAGRPYDAVTVEVHWACATGESIGDMLAREADEAEARAEAEERGAEEPAPS